MISKYNACTLRKLSRDLQKNMSSNTRTLRKQSKDSPEVCDKEEKIFDTQVQHLNAKKTK